MISPCQLLPLRLLRSQKIRAGNPGFKTVTVKLLTFKDPQGFDVTSKITAMLTNNDETLCPCTGGARSPCTCVGDAAILDGSAAARLLPFVSPRRGAPDAASGRVYALRFTGTSQGTGLACEGVATVCTIKQPRVLTGPAPECAPFESTHKSRDATNCTVVP